MCHYLGWQLGSEMPNDYVHLSGRDIYKAIYSKVYGIKTEESMDDGNIRPVVCPRCRENCGPTSEYCYRCGMPLKEEKVFEMEKKNRILREEFINETMEDSTKLQTFKKIMELIEAIDSDPEIKMSSGYAAR